MSADLVLNVVKAKRQLRRLQEAEELKRSLAKKNKGPSPLLAQLLLLFQVRNEYFKT